MNSPIIHVDVSQWSMIDSQPDWIKALESGRVLHFTHLPYEVHDQEKVLLTPNIQNPKARNISLDSKGVLKGAIGDEDTQKLLKDFILRFRESANHLVNTLVPKYSLHLKVSPTSFRPFNVVNRKQSWRADDKRLHVDSFATRPNYGERILRVFMNINPHGVPRVWRIGDTFENIAEHFLPRVKPYSAFQAKVLNKFGLTKSFRSEYDHLMLQIHDAMKSDDDYQKNSKQIEVGFMPGDVWVCFSDQTSHAAMSGQYMMEQTYNLPVGALYNTNSSPLAILEDKMRRKLV